MWLAPASAASTSLTGADDETAVSMKLCTTMVRSADDKPLLKACRAAVRRVTSLAARYSKASIRIPTHVAAVGCHGHTLGKATSVKD